jgi:multidrug efflux pump subunit AcrB
LLPCSLAPSLPCSLPNDHCPTPRSPTRQPTRLAKFFFLQPIFAILLAILCIIGGLLGYTGMIKESNPDINIAAGTVTTAWIGADPSSIEQQVTNELEQEISSIEELKQMKSASYSGVSVISVEFRSDADVARSIQQLRDAVSQAEPELPEDAEQPVVEQVSIQDVPLSEIESELIGTRVRFYGKFRSLEDLRQLPVARFEDRVVRLGEVATVQQGLEEQVTNAAISWQGAEYEPVVSILVKKVPGEDSIAVIDQALAELEQLQQNADFWPPALDYRVLADDSKIIWEQLGNLFINALQAMAAVFVILFIAPG